MGKTGSRSLDGALYTGWIRTVKQVRPDMPLTLAWSGILRAPLIGEYVWRPSERYRSSGQRKIIARWWRRLYARL
jgi:hypothetical protein